MKRQATKEWSVEEYDAWSAATDRVEAVARAADEEGGPSLSLVPAADRGDVWPTDLLPPIPPRNGEGDQPQAGGGGQPQAGGAAPAPPPAAHPLAGAAASGEPASPATPFDGVALEDSRKRLAGWSAERQRLFLCTLAETGSVHLAGAAARLSARSAYRLRARSPAFAAAWDTAQQLAVGRLSALAFDRAINGATHQVWQQGELVAEKRVPSDRLLM